MANFKQLNGYNVKDEDARNAIETSQNVIASLQNKIEFLRNKKLLIIGDSTTDNATNPPNWVKLLTDMVASANINATVNTTLCNDGKSLVGLSLDIDDIENLQGDFDFVILDLGVNDCTGQYPLGNYNDTSETIDTNQFSVLGAFNKVANKLYEKFPNAICFYNTPKRTNFGNTEYIRTLPLSAYRGAIATQAIQKAWRIIDLANTPMLEPNARKNPYITDGLHPTSTYAPILLDFILTQLNCYGSSVWVNFTSLLSLQSTFAEKIKLGCDNHNNVHIEGSIAMNKTVSEFEVITDEIPHAYFFPSVRTCIYTDTNGVTRIGEIGMTAETATTCKIYFKPNNEHKDVQYVFLNCDWKLRNVEAMYNISY